MRHRKNPIFVVASVAACCIPLWLFGSTAEAQTAQTVKTANLTWDPYTPPADFQDITVMRGTDAQCTGTASLPPLLVSGVPLKITLPAAGAFPTTITDVTPPTVTTALCYELLVTATSGLTATSNRATINPPPAVLKLRVIAKP